MTKHTKPDVKWFDARLNDVGMSARQISLKLGTNYQIWRRIMTEGRECTIGESITLARELRAPWEMVISRLGFEIPERKCPIIGKVGPHGRISTFTPDEVRRTLAPPDVDETTVALLVDAPQSALGVFHGATLFYEPSAGVRPDAMGRLGIIELGDHPAPILGVLERSAALGRGRVSIYGTGEAVESRKLISAAPVLWWRAG